VEVKYRAGNACGGADYAISKNKQAKIRKVASWYMMAKKIPMDTFCRFDAVLIDGAEVTHIKNAW